MYRDGPDGGIAPQHTLCKLTLSLRVVLSQEAEVVPLEGPALLILTTPGPSTPAAARQEVGSINAVLSQS